VQDNVMAIICNQSSARNQSN